MKLINSNKKNNTVQFVDDQQQHAETTTIKPVEVNNPIDLTKAAMQHKVKQPYIAVPESYMKTIIQENDKKILSAINASLILPIKGKNTKELIYQKYIGEEFIILYSSQLNSYYKVDHQDFNIDFINEQPLPNSLYIDVKTSYVIPLIIKKKTSYVYDRENLSFEETDINAETLIHNQVEKLLRGIHQFNNSTLNLHENDIQIIVENNKSTQEMNIYFNVNVSLILYEYLLWNLEVQLNRYGFQFMQPNYNEELEHLPLPGHVGFERRIQNYYDAYYYAETLNIDLLNRGYYDFTYSYYTNIKFNPHESSEMFTIANVYTECVEPNNYLGTLYANPTPKLYEAKQEVLINNIFKFLKKNSFEMHINLLKTYLFKIFSNSKSTTSIEENNNLNNYQIDNTISPAVKPYDDIDEIPLPTISSIVPITTSIMYDTTNIENDKYYDDISSDDDSEFTTPNIESLHIDQDEFNKNKTAELDEFLEDFDDDVQYKQLSKNHIDDEIELIDVEKGNNYCNPTVNVINVVKPIEEIEEIEKKEEKNNKRKSSWNYKTVEQKIIRLESVKNKLESLKTINQKFKAIQHSNLTSGYMTIDNKKEYSKFELYGDYISILSEMILYYVHFQKGNKLSNFLTYRETLLLLPQCIKQFYANLIHYKQFLAKYFTIVSNPYYSIANGSFDNLIFSLDINNPQIYEHLFIELFGHMFEFVMYSQEHYNNKTNTIGMENINIIAKLMKLQRINDIQIEEHFNKLLQHRQRYFKCFIDLL